VTDAGKSDAWERYSAFGPKPVYLCYSAPHRALARGNSIHRASPVPPKETQLEHNTFRVAVEIQKKRSISAKRTWTRSRWPGSIYCFQRVAPRTDQIWAPTTKFVRRRRRHNLGLQAGGDLLDATKPRTKGRGCDKGKRKSGCFGDHTDDPNRKRRPGRAWGKRETRLRVDPSLG